MPRIKDIPGPYSFFFYSFDCNEPVHVHVRRDKQTCKFWLEPIQQLIKVHYKTVIEAWHEHCG